MTTKRFGERFRGKLGFDGLFSDNIPRFTDNARPQLVFDLGNVPYGKRALVHARLLDYVQTNQNHLDMYLVPSSAIMKKMEDVKLR